VKRRLVGAEVARKLPHMALARSTIIPLGSLVFSDQQ
jgi:hypothetical protein